MTASCSGADRKFFLKWIDRKEMKTHSNNSTSQMGHNTSEELWYHSTSVHFADNILVRTNLKMYVYFVACSILLSLCFSFTVQRSLIFMLLDII